VDSWEERENGKERKSEVLKIDALSLLPPYRFTPMRDVVFHTPVIDGQDELTAPIKEEMP
jgi:hypothetical protein